MLLIKKEKKEEGIDYFKVSGELDIISSDLFQQEIKENIQNDNKNIVLDFSELKFIDSTGLGILVNLKKEFIDNKKIFIVNPKKHIRKVFSITGLVEYFNVEEKWKIL